MARSGKHVRPSYTLGSWMGDLLANYIFYITNKVHRAILDLKKTHKESGFQLGANVWMPIDETCSEDIGQAVSGPKMFNLSFMRNRLIHCVRAGRASSVGIMTIRAIICIAQHLLT